MTTPTLHPYYSPRPGGHIRVTNAPTEDAATTLLADILGTTDVYEWHVDEIESTSRRLASINWYDESEDSWLIDHDWPRLITILTGNDIGFAPLDLTAALTEQRGPLTAAILRIAANLMAEELAELKLATDAGIPNAQTTYNKALEDPADWLHRVANLQEVILTD